MGKRKGDDMDALPEPRFVPAPHDAKFMRHVQAHRTRDKDGRVLSNFLRIDDVKRFYSGERDKNGKRRTAEYGQSILRWTELQAAREMAASLPGELRHSIGGAVHAVELTQELFDTHDTSERAKAKAKAFDKKRAKKDKDYTHMIEKNRDQQAEYLRLWKKKLIDCIIEGNGFTINLKRSQEKTATDLRNAANWPHTWNRDPEDPDDEGRWTRVPSAKVIARMLPTLESEMQKALYKHKPSSTHKRCDFCPRPS